MATKLYPPIIDGVLPAFCLTYDPSYTYLRATTLTVPFTMNGAVSEALVAGFSLRLRTVSSGSYLFEPIFSDNYDLIKQEVTFTLTSQQCRKLMEGQYYKAQIAYCGQRVINDAGIAVGLDIGYYSTVGVVKCTSHPTVTIKGMALSDINSFNNEFLGLYDISKCKDQTEKVYSYHFTIWDEELEICFESEEQLHKTIYDVEYTSSFDRISINDFLSDDKIYSIQYKVTTLNGLVLGSPKYKITNAYLVSPNDPILILPESNHELGYIDVRLKGKTNELNSYFLVFNEDAFLGLPTNEDGTAIFEDGQFAIANQVRKIVSGQKDMVGYCRNYSLYRKYLWILSRQCYSDQTYYILDKNVPSRIILYEGYYYDVFDYLSVIRPYISDGREKTDELKMAFAQALNSMTKYERVLSGERFVKKISWAANVRDHMNLDDPDQTDYLVLNVEEVEKKYYGTYLLSRASDADNYRTWYNLKRFKLHNEAPSTVNFEDYTVEHGRKYIYALLQYNLWGLYSTRMKSEEYMAVFEDTYIWDGKKAIRLLYNPEVSSFKTTILELKTDTVGGRFPFITRNGYTYYKEFPVGGLLAAETDELKYFIDSGKGDAHRHATPDAEVTKKGKRILPRNAYRNYRFFEDENIALEKDFKIKVLEWLNDGKPKMFKSPYEGNYIVRLMNNSLSPVKELGRLLHSFSSTAYEIAEYNYDNLIAFGFLNVSSPSEYVGAYKGFYLGDYDTHTDIILDMEGGVNSFTIQDMMPGDIIYLTVFGEEDELPIMIGVTGSYSYADLDAQVTKIRIPQRADGTKIIGVVNCYHLAIRITEFDSIISMLLKTIHGQLYVGINPWADKLRDYGFEENNLGLFLFTLSNNAYNALYDFNFRDYLNDRIRKTYNSKTQTYDTDIEYSVYDENGDKTNFLRIITSFDPGDILSRINLTLNRGDVYKTELVNLEMLRFRLRGVIPVYAFESKTNDNDAYGAYSDKVTQKVLGVTYKAVPKSYIEVMYNHNVTSSNFKEYYVKLKSGNTFVHPTTYSATETYYESLVNRHNFSNFFINVGANNYLHPTIYKENITYYEQYYAPSSSNQVLMVSTSPYGYPHPIEDLLKIEMLDPFCLFKVMVRRPKINGNAATPDDTWVPINEVSTVSDIGSGYYDPYYHTWLRLDYDPKVRLNEKFVPVVRLERKADGTFTDFAKLFYDERLLNHIMLYGNKEEENSSSWVKTLKAEGLDRFEIQKEFEMLFDNDENHSDPFRYYKYELIVDQNGKLYYGNNDHDDVYTNSGGLLIDRTELRDEGYAVLDDLIYPPAMKGKQSVYSILGEFPLNNYKELKYPEFLVFERDKTTGEFYVTRIHEGNRLRYNHIYWIKEPETELDLRVEKEITYNDLKGMFKSISLGNGAIAELSFLLRVLDFYTEIFDPDVIDKKAKYLAAKLFYSTLMETYRAISTADNERRKYYALKETYSRMLRGNVPPLAITEGSIIKSLLDNEKLKKELKLMLLYDIEMLNSALNQDIIDELIEFKEDINNNTAERYNILYAKIYDTVDTDGNLKSTVIDLGNPNCYIINTTGTSPTDHKIRKGKTYTDQNDKAKTLYKIKSAASGEEYYYLIEKDKWFNDILLIDDMVYEDTYLIPSLPLKDGEYANVSALDSKALVLADGGSPVTEYSLNNTMELIIPSLSVLNDEEFASVKLDPYFISGKLSTKTDKIRIGSTDYYMLNEETEMRTIAETDNEFKGVLYKYNAIIAEIEKMTRSVEDFNQNYDEKKRGYITAYNNLLTKLNEYNEFVYKSWVCQVIYDLATNESKWNDLRAIFLYLAANVSEDLITEFEEEVRLKSNAINYLYDYANSDIDLIQVYLRMINESYSEDLDTHLNTQIATTKGHALICLMALYDAGLKMKTAIDNYIRTYGPQEPNNTYPLIPKADYEKTLAELYELVRIASSKYNEIYSKMVNKNTKKLINTYTESQDYILATYNSFYDAFVRLNAFMASDLAANKPLSIKDYADLTSYYDDALYLLKIFNNIRSNNVTIGTYTFYGFQSLSNNNPNSYLSFSLNPYSGSPYVIHRENMSFDDKVEFTTLKNIITFHYRTGLVNYSIGLTAKHGVKVFAFDPLWDSGTIKVTINGSQKTYLAYYGILSLLEKSAVKTLSIRLAQIGEEMTSQYTFGSRMQLFNLYGFSNNNNSSHDTYVLTYTTKRNELINSLNAFKETLNAAFTYVKNKKPNKLVPNHNRTYANMSSLPFNYNESTKTRDFLKIKDTPLISDTNTSSYLNIFESFFIEDLDLHTCTRVIGGDIENFGIYYDFLEELRDADVLRAIDLLDEAIVLRKIYEKQLENYQNKFSDYNDSYEYNQGLYMSYFGTEAYDYYNKVNGTGEYSTSLTEAEKAALLEGYRNKTKLAWYEFLIFLDAKYTEEKRSGMYR